MMVNMKIQFLVLHITVGLSYQRQYTGTVPPNPETVDCSRVGAIKIGKKCLTISEDALNWHDAVTACTNNGGQLVSLQDRGDPEMLHDYIFTNHHGLQFWLGGSDIANEGQWVWMNGDPFQQFPQQPDNAHGGQDCLSWGWQNDFDDLQCERQIRYICELGEVVPILVDERDGPNADGSYSFNFETGDGTSVLEQGYPTASGAVAKKGTYSLTYPDGTNGVFKWIADENGFRVESPLLPTAPPIPPHAQAQIDAAAQA